MRNETEKLDLRKIEQNIVESKQYITIRRKEMEGSQHHRKKHINQTGAGQNFFLGAQFGNSQIETEI